MRYHIKGKEYTYTSNVKDIEKIRHSFNELSKNTFDLSFESWYQNGYWGESYIPHVLMDDGRVVANVSVNLMDPCWEGETKRYIQLGTVMTDEGYRNRGLARFLMEKVLAQWTDQCDAMYLFANDSVMDFYPKFGFVKAEEYQSRISVERKVKRVRKLNMSDEQDRALLLNKYSAYSNPYSALPVIYDIGLIMFYCSQFMRDSIFYVEEHDAVVIGEYDDNTLLCYDIYCDGTVSISEILSGMVMESGTDVKLGFPLKQSIDSKLVPFSQEDMTLFILAGKENLFSDNKLMFPLLSHA